jgi:hypothetical protein
MLVRAHVFFCKKNLSNRKLAVGSWWTDSSELAEKAGSMPDSSAYVQPPASSKLTEKAGSMPDSSAYVHPAASTRTIAGMAWRRHHAMINVRRFGSTIAGMT